MLWRVLVAVLALWLAGPAASGAGSLPVHEAVAAKKTVKLKAGKPAVPAQRKAKTNSSLELPMQVVIVRKAGKSCEPSCPEWIMAEGMITAATPKLLADVYERGLKRRHGAPLAVILHSAGGNIVAALQIGYFLRARMVDVAVGITLYEGCGPFSTGCTAPGDYGAYAGRLVSHRAMCLSACPLILAAGVRRLAGIDTTVGVHHWGYEQAPGADGMPKFVAQKDETAWDGVVRNMITGYLTTMGISLDVAADMNNTPFTTMELYDMKRRKRLKLVTEQSNVERVITAKDCTSSEQVSCR